ncbi:MAG: hypothetical protein H6741_24360 [Alphaproteobacteria bacterium]|nr:hypothetical protein [Alphaproteobacteria bacterium]
MSDPLSDWLSLRERPRAAVLEALQVDEAAVEHGLAYGPTTGLDMVSSPQVSPARVYLRGEEVVVVVIRPDSLGGLDPDTLAQRFPPEDYLPSRAGKAFEHAVAAGAGVAWSDDGQRVAILEFFPPTTVEDFKARLYVEPGTFTR